MRRLFGIALLLGMGPASTAWAGARLENATSTLDLSGVWLFHEGDSPAFARPLLDDYSWQQLQVPTQNLPNALRFSGFGWFRYHVEASERAIHTEYTLNLGPARHAVEAYVNGVRVGSRGRFGSRVRGGASVSPFRVDIPVGLMREGDNVLAIRIYDPSFKSGLPLGPLTLAPAQLLDTKVQWQTWLALGARWGTLALSLFVALAIIISQIGRHTSHDFWWLAGASLMWAVWLAEGTGALESTVPNLDLALRIPQVASVVGLLFLGTYFVHRFGVLYALPVRIAQGALALWGCFVLLAPSIAVFVAAKPVLWVAGIIMTLYSANLLIQSIRREEQSSLSLFFIMIAVLAALLYDGLWAQSVSMYPSLSALAGLAAILLTFIVNIRASGAEYEHVLTRMIDMRQRLQDRINLSSLDAAALALNDLPDFLERVVFQISNELNVRRCSVVLPSGDGELKIRASVGLPNHAVRSRIDKESSIAGRCYSVGKRITQDDLPQNVHRSHEGKYVTDAFISQPIFANGNALGVLNISDRNDGGAFSDADEERLASIAQKLGAVLAQTEDLTAPWQLFDEKTGDVVSIDASDLVQTVKSEKAAKRVDPLSTPFSGDDVSLGSPDTHLNANAPDPSQEQSQVAEASVLTGEHSLEGDSALEDALEGVLGDPHSEASDQPKTE